MTGIADLKAPRDTEDEPFALEDNRTREVCLREIIEAWLRDELQDLATIDDSSSLEPASATPPGLQRTALF